MPLAALTKELGGATQTDAVLWFHMYKFYGDTRVLQQHYSSVAR